MLLPSQRELLTDYVIAEIDWSVGQVLDALQRNGKVLIPAFAVERTQQLLYALNKLRERDCFPAIPIFVDSPLAVSATEIFRLHPECFNHSCLASLV